MRAMRAAGKGTSLSHWQRCGVCADVRTIILHCRGAALSGRPCKTGPVAAYAASLAPASGSAPGKQAMGQIVSARLQAAHQRD